MSKGMNRLITKLEKGIGMIEFFFPEVVFVTAVIIELIYLGTISVYDAVIQSVGFIFYLFFLMFFCNRAEKSDDKIPKDGFKTEEDAKAFWENQEVRRTREMLAGCIMQVLGFFLIVILTGLVETLCIVFIPWVAVLLVCGLYYVAKLIAVGDVDYIRGSKETKFRRAFAYGICASCLFSYFCFIYFIPIAVLIKCLASLMYFFMVFFIFIFAGIR